MWDFLKGFFDKLFRAFKSFLKGVMGILLQQGAAYILDIARVAVMEMAQTDLSSEEKRQAAFLKIQNYATTRGIAVSSSVIFSVVELVYQELQDNLRNDVV